MFTETYRAKLLNLEDINCDRYRSNFRRASYSFGTALKGTLLPTVRYFNEPYAQLPGADYKRHSVRAHDLSPPAKVPLPLYELRTTLCRTESLSSSLLLRDKQAYYNWFHEILNSMDVSWSNGYPEGGNNKMKVLKRI